jgi:hypothetical protein
MFILISMDQIDSSEGYSGSNRKRLSLDQRSRNGMPRINDIRPSMDRRWGTLLPSWSAQVASPHPHGGSTGDPRSWRSNAPYPMRLAFPAEKNEASMIDEDSPVMMARRCLATTWCGSAHTPIFGEQLTCHQGNISPRTTSTTRGYHLRFPKTAHRGHYDATR